jgi:hypothetical protein
MHDKIFALCEYDHNRIQHCHYCVLKAEHRLRLYIKPGERETSLSFNLYLCINHFKTFKEAMINGFNKNWYVKIELKEFSLENTLDFEVKPK